MGAFCAHSIITRAGCVKLRKPLVPPGADGLLVTERLLRGPQKTVGFSDHEVLEMISDHEALCSLSKLLTEKQATLGPLRCPSAGGPGHRDVTEASSAC